MPPLFPENQQIETNQKGTTYVNNLSVMLASELYDKNGKKTIIKKCNNQPPVNWWASEKWDGIRAIWDGEKFVSRGSGRGKPKVFSYVPDEFLKYLPKDYALDGEIWVSRNNFNKVSAISNLIPGGKYSRKEIDAIWFGKNPVVYKLYDIPSMTNAPFRERYSKLVELVKEIKDKYPDAPLSVTEQIPIKSEEHLDQLYRKLTSSGAEGVIIKDPDCLYETKRSKHMLKYKIHKDAEGVVIGHQNGTGRLDGTLGSLEIEVLDPNGKPTGITTFVGTGFTDIERTLDENNKYYIPKGTIISFKYMEMTKDSVRHPVFRGIRTD
jgi:DNA ligase-1